MKLSSGAEAVIHKKTGRKTDGKCKKSYIVKDRVKKNYRIPEIDTSLRQFRTRQESKVLEKLESMGFPAPKLIKTDRKSIIEMEHIDGEKIRDIYEKNPVKYSREIGKKLGVLHNNDIVHGDLTTSNMIFNGKEIVFIDFGLSKFSVKVEDKAVDIHLFRQAIESKHDTIWEKCYKAFLDSYKKTINNPKEIFSRLEKIESRGRNKGK
jgi:Kae1-associated kinase Bud32